RHSSWDGAALFEFAQGEARPRLTAVRRSLGDVLPLATAAGADLPVFLYDLLVVGRREFPEAYRTGVRSRQLASELARLRDVLADSRSTLPGKTWPRAWAIAREVARTLHPREHRSLLSLSDPRPGVQELRETGRAVWRGLRWRAARAHQIRRMRRAARRPA